MRHERVEVFAEVRLLNNGQLAEGRRIVEIQRKKKAELTEGDQAHMAKAVGYVKRHLAQGGPQDDVEHSKWRYSLMNWGHDPLR